MGQGGMRLRLEEEGRREEWRGRSEVGEGGGVGGRRSQGRLQLWPRGYLQAP